MNNHSKNNGFSKGFTLVEVLVASFIFASVSAIAVGIFALSSNIQISSEITRNILSDERLSIEQLSHDIKMADGGFEFTDPTGRAKSDQTQGDYLKIIFKDKPFKLYGLIPNTNKFGVREENGTWQSFFSDRCDILPDNNSGNFNRGYLFAGLSPSAGLNVQPFVNIEFIIDNSNYVNKESEEVVQSVRTAVTFRAYSEIEQ